MLLDIPSVVQGQSHISFSVADPSKETQLKTADYQWPRLKEGISGSIECQRNLEEIVATIRYNCTVEAECARCLKQVMIPIDGHLHLLIHPHPSRSEIVSDGLQTAEIYRVPDQQFVDFSELLFDEINTSIPMRPVCDPECELPRPRESSQSHLTEIDPRWEALKKLKKNIDSQK